MGRRKKVQEEAAPNTQETVNEEPGIQEETVTTPETKDAAPETEEVTADEPESKDPEVKPEPLPAPETKEEVSVVEETKQKPAKDINLNIAKIISELKQKPMYKFLSKVALIKIAGDILKNKHLWK